MTILLALLLASVPAQVAHADQSVAIAAHAQHDCFDPRECRIADELMVAALAEQVAANALATAHHGPSDPWQSDYAEPFDDLGPPEALEARAALDLAALQTAIDGLVSP